MVIERFKDTEAVRDRFSREGRLLPTSVTYCDSWVELGTGRCFQLMEANSQDALQPWIERWEDLVDFEIVPVESSSEFWR